MPLLCFRIISYSQCLVSDHQNFKFKANAFKSSKTIKVENHRSFSFLGPVLPPIASYSQCLCKLPKTIHLNRISTKFLIVKHLKNETVLWSQRSQQEGCPLKHHQAPSRCRSWWHSGWGWDQLSLFNLSLPVVHHLSVKTSHTGS